MAARGRYTLLRKVADGGTAEVFLAHMEGSAGFKRLVVLKRVRPTLWADEQFRRGLIDEAHIAMGLHHGNIVQVLDLGVAVDRYFLAFELVDGWTLAQVFRRAVAVGMSMPLNLALHVMAETCRGLAYAHNHTENGVPMGIVHRDVTPQNVLLSEQGDVKLTDFGIARARNRQTTSQVGTVKGKPAYMSPEQAEGKPLDARSDLFPIGTMLYQLATGELPFNAGSAPDNMRRIIAGQFTPLDVKRPDLPVDFIRLVNKCLEHDVGKRFQSADELLRAIEKVQRTVFEPAGQTELKTWLAALSAKDGAQPLSRANTTPTAPPELPQDTTGPIELQDEDIVVVTDFSEKPATAVPPPPRAGTRWWLAVPLLALTAGAWWWSTARPTTTPPPAVTSASLARAPAPELPQVPTAVDAGEPDQVPAAPDAGELRDAGDGGDAVDAGDTDADVAVVVGDSADASVATVAEDVDAGDLVDAGHFDAGSQQPPLAPSPVAQPPAPVPTVVVASETRATKDDVVSVLFESEPTGASVRIDRNVFGKTPIPLRLKVGIAFELVFTKEGYGETKATYFVTRKLGQKVRVVLPKKK